MSDSDEIGWDFTKQPKAALADKLSQAADGYSCEDVAIGSLTLFANAVRRFYPDADSAVKAVDDMIDRVKVRLREEFERSLFQ